MGNILAASQKQPAAKQYFHAVKLLKKPYLSVSDKKFLCKSR